MRIAAFLAAALVAASCTIAPRPDEAPARAALAPTGALRMGLYPGSPTSYLPGAEPKGVGFDVGRELARRLGVAYEPVVLPSNAQVQEAARANRVDLVLTNATEERAKFLDFTPAVLRVAKSYLVRPGSALASIEGVDGAGVRVGVSAASTTQAELAQILRRASVVPVKSLGDARRMLAAGEIDAFASNNAILSEMGDAIPGSKLLSGHWGLETFALGVPKGRDTAGLDWLRDAAAGLDSEGFLARVADKAGVRGTIR